MVVVVVVVRLSATKTLKLVSDFEHFLSSSLEYHLTAFLLTFSVLFTFQRHRT